MGIEYQIVCDAKAVADFDNFIRRQPFFESYDETCRLYNLRDAEATSREGMPDAFAAVNPAGIYFCDNGPSKFSAWIFRRVIDHALSYSDSITVHEP